MGVPAGRLIDYQQVLIFKNDQVHPRRVFRPNGEVAPKNRIFQSFSELRKAILRILVFANSEDIQPQMNWINRDMLTNGCLISLRLFELICANLWLVSGPHRFLDARVHSG